MKTLRALRNKCRRNRDGGALLMVLMVLMVMSILGLGLMAQGSSDAVETVRDLSRAEAFWMAEAGLNELKAIITLEENRRPLDRYDLVNEDAPVLSRTFEGVGSYEVYVREATAEQGDEGMHYAVEVIGRSKSGADPVRLTSALRLPTISEDVYTSNDEGSIWFSNSDKIYGPMRTNGRLNIDGTPTFYGYVRTSASTVNYDSDSGRLGTYIDPRVFTAGLEFGAPESDFNPDLIDEMEEKSGMAPIESDCDISFISDSRYVVSEQVATTAYRDVTVIVDYEFQEETYYDRRGRPRTRWVLVPIYDTREEAYTVWTTVSSTNYIDSIGTPDIDDNIIYVTGDVTVHGEVGGRVSVVSEGKITIIDDIIYSSTISNPDHTEWADDYEPDSDETLGLYAKEMVQIDQINPWDDINVHASIFVTEQDVGDSFSRGFCVNGTDASTRLGEPTINLYGSIMQYQRGGVGYLGGYGYVKRYCHDERFRLAPPPGSPYAPPEFFGWKMADL
ncbi:MAG: hypothetical protein JXR25_00335 [Pontiellaceae bacterium]|nr:hypothetical protein [Pontiellaceae bacterium]MBN2783246.1 hypothetical protein [Pontiellaceae bacterium]